MHSSGILSYNNLPLDLYLILLVYQDPQRMFPFMDTRRLYDLLLMLFNHHFLLFNSFNGHHSLVPGVASVCA
jgi:hypothetical protein